MGELLTNLYDDFLAYDEVAERPAATEPVAKDGEETATQEQQEEPTIPPRSGDSQNYVRMPQWPAMSQTAPRHIQPKPAVDSGVAPASSRVKYFIMKSNNSTNIDRSLASGVWSTQHHNEAKLNTAYLDGFEVRLVFSINQSGHFQGYAAMKSAIGRGPKHNIWVGSAWGGFFEVDWQLQYDFPFSRFEHLSNPLNEGKPVKFARDGQEIPAEVGNEMVRIMQDIARSNGVSKPIITNQLKVEPYPAGSLPEGRFPAIERRGSYSSRDRGMGGGRGYRWPDGYGRYSGGGYNAYPYPSSAVSPYPSRWSGPSAYKQPYPTDYPREGYGSWGYEPTEEAIYAPPRGQKRPRSPSHLEEGTRKKSLYEMTYEEYLDCYERVQRRMREIIYTGELWKALGMIPGNYVWRDEDQKRIVDSGWFSAWFGTLAEADKDQGVSAVPIIADVESSSGSRVMTDTEFVDFCRLFCGEQMHFDETRIRDYYEMMESTKDMTTVVEKKLRCV